MRREMESNKKLHAQRLKTAEEKLRMVRGEHAKALEEERCRSEEARREAEKRFRAMQLGEEKEKADLR